MAEQPKPKPEHPEHPEQPKPKIAAETATKFTMMRNVSGKILQLACGAVEPGEEVAFNAAEFSMLYMYLEGIE
jgi:hypothetical protein